MTAITLKSIDDEIVTFTVNAKALNEQAHTIAMMIFRHAAPKDIADCNGSGDCTRAVKLVRAMPASFRRTMMIEWFAKNTPIRVKLSDNGDKCQYDPKYAKLSKEDKLKAWDIENANSEPFYELAEKTPEEKTYDFAALVKMVERVGKQIEKKLEEGKVLDQDIESAKSIARTVNALRFNHVKPDNVSNDTTANDKDDNIKPEGVNDSEEALPKEDAA